MKPRSLLKSFLFATALGFSCSPQLATAQGNLVVNGGFNTDASGWTVLGGYYNGKNGNPPGEVLLFGTGSASQTVSGLSAGATYVVSGYYQGGPGGVSSGPSFEVTMNGVVLYGITDPGNNNWNSFSFFYPSSSSTAALSIDIFVPQTGAYALDNISMTAVPEPSAWVLTILGGCILFYSQAQRVKGSVI